MKRNLIFLVGMIVSLSCGATVQKGFTISGHTDPNGYPVAKMILEYTDAVKGAVRDTSNIEERRFSFQGNLLSPGRVLLYIIPDSNLIEPKRRFPVMISFMIENCVMDMYFKQPNDYSITGSALFEQDRIFRDWLHHKTKGLQGKNYSESAKQYRFDYIRVHPKEYYSLLILEDMVKVSRVAGEYRNLYDSLDPVLKTHPKGMMILQRLDALDQIKIGSKAPSFKLTDRSGNAVNISSFNGKYVFLHFWASWCTPCRNENVHLKKTYEQLDTSRIIFIGISLDQNDTRIHWEQALVKDQLGGIQLIDTQGFDSQVAKSYGVKGVPRSFLIDPQGMIVAMDLRGVGLAAGLSSFFKTQMPE